LDIQSNFNYIFEKREIAEKLAEEVINTHYTKENYSIHDMYVTNLFVLIITKSKTIVLTVVFFTEVFFADPRKLSG
jgi:hypothetical protein